MKELEFRIAGEIALSQKPGSSMKKWREIFGITQTELADFLKITPSTISDYEASRRKSPGTTVIKRFVSALCEIDAKKGAWTLKKLVLPEKTDVYQVFEFLEPKKSLSFIKKISGRVVSNEEVLKDSTIYGCTLVDALRAILELPADEFIKIYGATTERALIFTNVSMGRSPMVAIRVTKLKPTFVVFHGLTELDKLALKISELEKIPIITTNMPLDELKAKITEAGE